MKKGLYLTLNLKRTMILSSMFIIAVTLPFLLNFSDVSTDVVQAAAEKEVTIIIDPGHGGEDGGTQSETGVLEKDINLSISLKIRDILADMGYSVVMTREDDRLIYDDGIPSMREKKKSDIYKRLEIMNSYDNSVFLSVHQNYFTQSKYSGAQVFYSKNNSDSKILASKIQSSIKNSLQPQNNRQIKESGSSIYLLDNAQKVAVMVECGFMSNPEEAAMLNDSNYQNEMSAAIVEGLIDFLESKNEGEASDGIENKKHLRLQ